MTAHPDLVAHGPPVAQGNPCLPRSRSLSRPSATACAAWPSGRHGAQNLSAAHDVAPRTGWLSVASYHGAGTAMASGQYQRRNVHLMFQRKDDKEIALYVVHNSRIHREVDTAHRMLYT